MSHQLHFGDCCAVLETISGVDMLLVDLPYGKTQCQWDCEIPLDRLWPLWLKAIKKHGAMVFTAAQPFASVLVMSNPKLFRYDLVWEKTSATGHLNAKKQPLRAHESILIFCQSTPPYNPIKTFGHVRKSATADRATKQSDCYGSQAGVTRYDATDRYPRSVLKFKSDKQKCCLHPTQKPVELMKWLIETYSNPGDLVLDHCMGSGTTGVACQQSGRRFIGVENDAKYFAVAKSRLEQ